MIRYKLYVSRTRFLAHVFLLLETENILIYCDWNQKPVPMISGSSDYSNQLFFVYQR